MTSITSKISIIILSLMACTFTFAEDKPAEGGEMCEAELQEAHERCEESGATDCSTTPGRFQPPVAPCPSDAALGMPVQRSEVPPVTPRAEKPPTSLK
jgi:hypothetical protein